MDTPEGQGFSSVLVGAASLAPERVSGTFLHITPSVYTEEINLEVV